MLKHHGKITCTLQSASSYTAERKYEVSAEKELYLFRLEQYHPLPFQFIDEPHFKRYEKAKIASGFRCVKDYVSIFSMTLGVLGVSSCAHFAQPYFVHSLHSALTVGGRNQSNIRGGGGRGPIGKKSFIFSCG